MAHKKKLILKSEKMGPIIYTVKAEDDIIWQGRDIHKRFNVLKAAHKGKNLSVSWRYSKEYLSV